MKTVNATIRPAWNTDAQALLRMQAALAQQDAIPVPPLPAGGDWFVATAPFAIAPQGVVIAMGHIEVVAALGRISHFFVAPPHRRRGVGSALLARIIEAAIDRDAESIDLVAATDNHAALRFYAHHGFRPGTFPDLNLNNQTRLILELSREKAGGDIRNKKGAPCSRSARLVSL